MSLPRWIPQIAARAIAAVAAVVALTWALEHVVPPPYSGYLALVVVGLVATEVFKRQPRQRARRMFRIYLYARERGAAEPEARTRLLGRLSRNPETRQALARDLEARWVGPFEKDRATAGVALLLAHAGKALDAETLGAAYDRERDRFTIAGWEALPSEFVETVFGRLDERERDQLNRLVDEYRLFQQKFFKSATSLAADPAAGATDFARLLHSMGNQLTKDHPGDAERAYRLSLRLRPEENLAHAGLALLLEQTGRLREAAQQAKAALGVLDGYVRRAADRTPSTEDISPFRSPAKLREALERLAGNA
jgi:hypothetical protein